MAITGPKFGDPGGASSDAREGSGAQGPATAAVEIVGVSPPRSNVPDTLPPRAPHALRVVTYNIHSCVGTDRVVSLERVCEVLASLEPDVIALQEVDVGRLRTGRVHQAERIAEALGMQAVFQRAVRWPDGEYGIATLSRLPVQRAEGRRLPALRLPYLEQRVAVMLHLRHRDTDLVLVNTHLGLLSRERRLQTAYLQGWLSGVARDFPTVLCGDLNAPPRAPECRLLDATVTDAFGAKASGVTFPVQFPLTRLDHIRVSRQLDCQAVAIPRTALARAASDHYPVVADIALRESYRRGETSGRPPDAAC